MDALEGKNRCERWEKVTHRLLPLATGLLWGKRNREELSVLLAALSSRGVETKGYLGALQ